MPLDERTEFHVTRCGVDVIRPLRHRVLRAGLPPETARFEGDEAQTTRHYAAVADVGEVVGCATLVASTWEGEPAWQLRGMAVADGWRGRGVGAAIVAAMESDVASDANAPRQLWCNARVPAIPFYLRQGWVVASEEFHIPTAGPHRRMTKRLDGP